MIAYSIEAAAQTGLFDRVIVSTDDDAIADVAAQFGAETPFRRPAELSDDHTGTTDVIVHAIEWLTSDCGSDLSSVCCIYATAPFIDQNDIKQGLSILESGNWNYVFAATNFAAPIFRSFKTGAHGGLEMFFPEHYATRSQDLPEALHDAGQFYWGRPQAWLSKARVFGALSTVVALPRWRVQDIDTEDDWARAELIAHAINSLRQSGHKL